MGNWDWRTLRIGTGEGGESAVLPTQSCVAGMEYQSYPQSLGYSVFPGASEIKGVYRIGDAL